MPVYHVQVKAYQTDVGTAEQERLVEAKNAARAMAHICQEHIIINIPTSAELVALGKDGVTIEQAE